jgi:hypothetical protein
MVDMNRLIEARVENLMEEYLRTKDKAQPKFESIHTRAKFFSRESLQKYKSILQNVKEYDGYGKIMRYLRSDDYIDEKLETLMKGGFDIATCINPYLKVKALRIIEEKFDTNISSGAINGEDGPIELDECIFKLARATFKQKKPTSKHALLKFFVAAIKHHVSPDIVETSRVRHGDNRSKYNYRLNTELVLQHLVLNSLKNCKLVNVKTQYKPFILSSMGQTMIPANPTATSIEELVQIIV